MSISFNSFFRKNSTPLSNSTRQTEFFILVLILTLGLWIRVEDLGNWKKSPDHILFKGEPLLTTADGPFYLDLARDLIEGTYHPVDEKRCVPENARRPMPPPLLSSLAYVIAKLTNISLNWVGTLLPALLGPLLALPLYGLGRYYGGPVTGLVAAAVGVLCPVYIFRSNMGWFDTDCLNVTFATSLSYCFLKFGVEDFKRRYYYLGLGIFVFILFLWWWDQAPHAVTLFWIIPFTLSVIFFYRPSRKEGIIFFVAVLSVTAIVLTWKGVDLPFRLFKDVDSHYSYISKKASHYFPNPGVTVTEQIRPRFHQIASSIMTGLPAFFIALSGFILLILKHPKTWLFNLALVLIGGLSFIFAGRFQIFLIPLAALGTGYITCSVWKQRNKYKSLGILAPAILIAVLGNFCYRAVESKTIPAIHPRIIAGMDTASKTTSPDAVIWTWWDYGYFMNYWSRRATISDGSNHGGERSVYNALPLASKNFRLSANFIHFFSERGIKGINKFYKAVGNDPSRGYSALKKILSVGPEQASFIIEDLSLHPVGNWKTSHDWLIFFFPKEKRPVYLFLDNRLTKSFIGWYWFGTWDISKQTGTRPFYRFIKHIEISRNNSQINKKSDTRTPDNNQPGANINLGNGIFTWDSKMIPLKTALIAGDKKIGDYEIKSYERKRGARLEVFKPVGFGALMDEDISESVFNKLFLRHTWDHTYFKPVAVASPDYQLWEVRGDTLPESF